MTVLLYFAICYAFILIMLIIGLFRRKKNTGDTQKRFISVVIACKNEQLNIADTIASLIAQTYDKDCFEVILADDASIDDTANIIKKTIEPYKNFYYIYVSPEAFPHIVGKKKAITAAVAVAQGDILAFTDADCVAESGWLSDINTAFAGQIDFYAGFSPLYASSTLIASLKFIERASIFAVSAGGFGWGIPITVTARNMAYTRHLWDTVGGFAGIEHLRSGDDDLMLHKAFAHSRGYHFSLNPLAVVKSYDKKTAKEQFHAETRRASKYLYYPFYIKLLVLFVLIFYSLLVYRIGEGIYRLHFDDDLMYVISGKIILEFTLVWIFLHRFQIFLCHWLFLLAEILYIPYFFFFGILGSIGKYKWKS